MAAEDHAQRQRVKASNKPNKNEKKVQSKSYSKVDSVLSPHNCTFIPRTTIQRTPRKLCTLTLPPPLSTLFDEPNAPLETQPNSNPRHKRAPSDLNSTAFSVDPSLITESSHPTPGSRYYSGASVSSPDIPSYLRIGMSCDPLIAFDLVLVATTDGRIAVYAPMDYGLEVDEDVMASERRRRSEWEEEDIAGSDVDGDEKKLTDNSFTNDDYGDDTAIERMTKRERSRECVDPLLVIPLPIQHANRSSSEEDSSNPLSQTNQVLPMVVGMCAAPKGVSVIENVGASSGYIGHVAVLTDDGGVHLLEFQSGDDVAEVAMHDVMEENSEMYKSTPVVKMVCSFRTNYLGANCICMQPMFEHKSTQSDKNHDNKTFSHVRSVRLCIGHERGVLECYQLTAPCSQSEQNAPEDNSALSSPYSIARSKSNEIPRSNSKTNLSRDSPRRNTSFTAHLALDPGDDIPDDSFDPSTKLFRTYSEPKDQLSSPPTCRKVKHCSESFGMSAYHINIHLCWRVGTNAPIRSLSCPGWSSSLVENKAQSLLVIGMMQRASTGSRLYDFNRAGSKHKNLELSPAVSLEVIDTTIAQGNWLGAKAEKGADQDGNYTNSVTVPINECSVWPAAGMEIKDGWMRDCPKELVRQTRGPKSISVTNATCHFVEYAPCFAFSASDGTVGMLNISDDGSWGIVQDFNQILLPQRCIGIGAIESTTSNKARHVCCCLRGGTLYVVPVMEHGEKLQEEPLTMFVAPLDASGEDDGLVRYVQNFASGVVQLTCWQWPKQASPKPVVLLGWNGGTIDVYDVSPIEHAFDTALCGHLLANGGSALIEKLLIVSRSHPLISSALWRDAWVECNKRKDLDSILKGVKDESTTDFASTRALLMSLIQ